MRTRLWSLVLPALLFGLTTSPGLAQQPKGDPKDKEALAKKAEAFVEAFHKGDAKALAAFWTPDGDYTDQTGRQLKGREAIEKAFQGLFAENKGVKLRIDSDSLRFVTPDVAIEDGRVSAIGPGLDGDRVLDAGDHVVAPGFIDIHTHYDAQVFWDPALTPSCFHGVTTVVAGNCGFSIAPTRPEHREVIARTLENVEDMDVETLGAGIPWDFATFPEYLESVGRHGIAMNFAAYIGHTALRAVLGEHERAFVRLACFVRVLQGEHRLAQREQVGSVGGLQLGRALCVLQSALRVARPRRPPGRPQVQQGQGAMRPGVVDERIRRGGLGEQLLDARVDEQGLELAGAHVRHVRQHLVLLDQPLRPLAVLVGEFQPPGDVVRHAPADVLMAVEGVAVGGAAHGAWLAHVVEQRGERQGEGRFGRQVAEHEKDVSQAIIRCLSDHLRTTMDCIANDRLQTAPQRVAHYLLTHCNVEGGPASIRLPFQKSLLAGKLGLAPEALSRAFSALRRAGVIVRGRTIQISDVNALKQI